MDDLQLIFNFFLSVVTEIFTFCATASCWLLMTPIVFFVLDRVVKVIKKIL